MPIQQQRQLLQFLNYDPSIIADARHFARAGVNAHLPSTEYQLSVKKMKSKIWLLVLS